MKVRLIKVLVISIFLLSIFVKIPHSKNNPGNDLKQLKFNSDGSFKILQFADIQDDHKIDNRTVRLMERILDYEKPDLVLLTGDNIDGSGVSSIDVKRAIDNIAAPMEKRHIPWAIIFGNHDDENGILSKKEMMKIYMSYPFNMSQMGPEDVDGVGNYNLLIYNSKGEKPVFNIYMLDSGKYAPKSIGGYDWIKFSQIQWYRTIASNLKKQFNSTIPALMFFHIPLPEWNQGFEKGSLSGVRNEDEGASNINSGLFASIIEMNDVKGIFAGHDHSNDYIAELYGIKLGYSRNVGYGAYGTEGFSRGARVFLIKESNPGQFETWMRLESDF